jgi:hypothetical protein
MNFNVDFLGKNLLLSEECKNVLGATRNMQIYEIDLINVFYNELLNKHEYGYTDFSYPTESDILVKK